MNTSLTIHQLWSSVGNRQVARDLGINESSIREAAPKNKCIVSPKVTATYPQIGVQLCLYIEEFQSVLHLKRHGW